MSVRAADPGNRVLRGAGFAVLAAGLLTSAPGCRQRGRPDPAVRMAVSHERAIAPSGSTGEGGPTGANVPAQLDIPPQVAHEYTGIRLTWKDRGDGKSGTIDVPLGGETPLPDASLVVKTDAFLPAFTMGAGSITSEGVEPTNPAARIAVFEKGQQIFGGWIFTKFPDIHPFTHKRFELRLEGGIRKSAKPAA